MIAATRRNQFWATSALVLAIALPRALSADIIEFMCPIDGLQADDCTGTAPGTGSGVFFLNTETGIIDFQIEYSGLGSIELESHVHGAAGPCVVAGTLILYILPIGPLKIGQAFLTPAQRADMMNGLHFVIIHTLEIPLGELRGQILPANPDAPFLRGDANKDGLHNIADAVFELSYLFSGGSLITCYDALDTNDDGAVNIADPINLLTVLFAMGAPPPPPFVACGSDPTPDSLSCLSHSACP